MSNFITYLTNWKSSLAGAGMVGVLGLIFAFIIDWKTMSRGELDRALELTRMDLTEERHDHDLTKAALHRTQEAYQALAAAYWDEPVIGWIKGRNGRYIQANKKFVEDLVIGKQLDPNHIISFNDYEIWATPRWPISTKPTTSK